MTRAVVTGGAGFLGSHLCRRLVAEGWDVICLDSLLTGAEANVGDLLEHPRFQFERCDITKGIEVSGGVDWVLHLASPASPVDYTEHPIHTMKVGALGTLNALGLTRARGAGFMLTSTSEVYGDPEVHPQPETYWGNVNPIGPRGVYDEAKRFAEAMTMAYRRAHGVSIRIARIFNTYGPGMRRGDGRAVPTFIEQALAGEPLTVHGEGTQTRSLCFVDDMIEGFWRLITSDIHEPVNLGNDEEITVRQLAEAIRDAAESKSEIVFLERPVDDPEVRRPDLQRAREWLGWQPEVPLAEGLKRTMEWARVAWVRRPASTGSP
ncbi:MAG: SDR family oxidoreductase [Actinomycetota bacterium]|nr:SDR family oxidoreductase [Actinomycetota bacterium]